MTTKHVLGSRTILLVASILSLGGAAQPLSVSAQIEAAEEQAPAEQPAEEASDAAAEPAAAEPAAAEPAAAEPAAAEPAATEDGKDKKKGALKDLKVALGLRAGYALPLGDFAKGSPLDSNVSGGVPIGFDAALRLKNIELGLYASVLIGFAGKELEQDCADCSVFGLRVGAQANYHLLPDRFVDPWIGVGIGLEQLTYSESRTVQAITTSGDVVDIELDRTTDFRALPELSIQAGVDFGGGPITVGPFVSFSIAQYSEYEIEVKCRDFRCGETDLASRSGDIANTATHSWLTVGLRGTYLLF
jgi:hypothetical protein